jgi:hypothetical protein
VRIHEASEWAGKKLSSRSLPLLAAFIGVLLTFPTIWKGFELDDVVHRLMLHSSAMEQVSDNPWVINPEECTLSRAITDLFSFIHPGINKRLMDIGVIPWWSHPELKLSFFRPLASITHWVDYRLWPDSPFMMHVHSLTWFALVCAAAAFCFRRFMGATIVAGLAAVVFAFDEAHLIPVAWIASRNGLIALLFGILALVAHDRAYRGGWKAGVAAGPLLFLLAVASGEPGYGAAAYIVAHVVVLCNGSWRRKALILLPYVLITVTWLLASRTLGYGAFASGLYTDPLHEPGLFAAELIERAPILLLGLWARPDPVFYSVFSSSAITVLWISALATLVAIGIAITPLLRTNTIARFWLLSMTLAVVPACALSVPTSRPLLFAGLGMAALLAQFIHGFASKAEWLPQSRPLKRTGRFFFYVFILIHLVYAPLHSIVMSIVATPPVFKSEHYTDIGDIRERQTVLIVNAPSPFYFIYMTGWRMLNGQPLPSQTRLLAPGYFDIAIARLDERTLLVRPDHGYLVAPGLFGNNLSPSAPPLHPAHLFQHLDKTFRSDAFPMMEREPVSVPGMTVTVTAFTGDGRPLEARVQLSLPLESASLKWLFWDWEREAYGEFIPPRIGETTRVAGCL